MSEVMEILISGISRITPYSLVHGMEFWLGLVGLCLIGIIVCCVLMVIFAVQDVRRKR